MDVILIAVTSTVILSLTTPSPKEIGFAEIVLKRMINKQFQYLFLRLRNKNN